LSGVLHGFFLLPWIIHQQRLQSRMQVYQLTEVELVKRVFRPEAEIKSLLERILPPLPLPFLGRQIITESRSASSTVRFEPPVGLTKPPAKVIDIIPEPWIDDAEDKIPVQVKGGKSIDLNAVIASAEPIRPDPFFDAKSMTGAVPKLRDILAREDARPEDIVKKIQKDKRLQDVYDQKNKTNSLGLKDGYSISGEIATRKVLNAEMPLYPAWAEEQGIEGEVTLHVMVESDGNIDPESIYIVKTSGYSDLDSYAREALSRWIFEPQKSSGAKRGQEGSVRFVFKLKK
jgi:TonB family protein